VVARLGQPDDVVTPAFRAVYGEPRAPMPSLAELYNLLLQIGIPASVTMHPTEQRWNYADADAAVADVASRLAVQPGSPQWQRVETAVRSQLVPRRDEVLLAPRQAYQGIVWWEAGTRIERT